MKKLHLLLSILVISLSTGLLAGTSYKSAKELFGRELPDEPTSIKVLVAQGLDEPRIQTHGRYRVFDPKTQRRLTYGFFGKDFNVIPLRDGLQWGEVFPDVYQMTVFSDSKPNLVSVNGRPYKGRITLYAVNGRLNVVNEVSLEDYTKSVLSECFPNEKNPEILAALSICIRTTAMYQKEDSSNPYWDVEAQDVNYTGYSITLSNPLVVSAVDQTKEMVMNYRGPFMATWTEHSAGKTAPYPVIYRQDANAPKEVVTLSYAELDKKNTAWSVPITKARLAQIAELDKITDVALYQDQQSGKVYGMRMFNGEQTKDIPFTQLRNILGEDQLKSSDFKITWIDDTLLLTGYGRGPGVGVCLYSAKVMTEKGFQAHELLNTFFPGSSIVMMKDLNETLPRTHRIEDGMAQEKKLIIIEETR